MKENSMSYKGVKQGDMAPQVMDYHPKESEFAGSKGSTLDYIERRDRIQTKEAKEVKSQVYKGRYDS